MPAGSGSFRVGSAGDYGLTVSAEAVGGIVGGLIAASAGNRLRASRLLGWGAVAFGAIDLVTFLIPPTWIAVWPAVVCMAVAGLPGVFRPPAVTFDLAFVGDSVQDGHGRTQQIKDTAGFPNHRAPRLGSVHSMVRREGQDDRATARVPPWRDARSC